MKWLNLSPKQRRDAARPQRVFYPMPPFFGIWGWFLTWGRCRWHWVKTGIPSTTGWWWLEHDWIMTFQKQLGMESSSQLTKSIIVQRGWLKPPPRHGVHWRIQNHSSAMHSPETEKNQLRLRHRDCKIDCLDTPENCNLEIPSISWSLRVAFHKIVDHGQNILLDHKFKHSEWPWDITRYHIDSVDEHLH